MLRQLHEWNSLVCFLLSVALNLLLTWLVLKRTSKEMKQYSRILLQTVVLDLLVALSMELVQPVIFMDNGAIIMYLNGPLVQRIDSALLRFVLFDTWLWLYYLAMFGLGVQFLYRYLVLVRRASVSPAKYMLLLCVPVLGDVAICASFYFCALPNAQNERIANPGVNQLLSAPSPDQPLYAAFYANATDPLFAGVVAFNVLFDTLCYAVISVCGYRMVRFMRKHAKQQPHLAEVNKQITRNLILMATLPLFLLANNLLLCLLALFLPTAANSLVLFELLACLPVHWLPLFNPLVTILTVRQYRQTVFCRKAQHQNNQQTGLVVVTQHFKKNNLTRVEMA